MLYNISHDKVGYDERNAFRILFWKRNPKNLEDIIHRNKKLSDFVDRNLKNDQK
jgi:hypothetical protein